jgi:hypothetical protein
MDGIKNDIRQNKKNLIILSSELTTLEHRKVEDFKGFITDYLNALDDCRKFFIQIKTNDENESKKTQSEINYLKSLKKNLTENLDVKDMDMHYCEDDVGTTNVYFK